MPGRFGGIGRRLVFLCLGLYFLVACLLTVGEAIIASYTVQEEREAQIDILATTNVPALTQAVWDFDSPIIELILRGLVVNPAVGKVELLSPDGTVLSELEAQRPEAKFWQGAHQIPSDLGVEHKYRLTYSRPGENESNLGDLIICPSLFAEHQQFWKTIAMGLSGVVVLVVFLSIILAIAVESLIGHPVRDLADQIARVNTSDPCSADLRIPRQAKGELAFIASAFIDLVGKIGSIMSTLRESEQRMRSLFEDSPISIWEEDFSEVKGRLGAARNSGVSDWCAYFESRERVIEYASLVKLIDINSATLSLLGYADKSEILKGLSTVDQEESLDAWRSEFIALASGRKNFETETVHFNAKGTRIFVNVKLCIVPGYEENWSRVIVSLIDLTERKKAERALKESEAKYRCLIEQSTEGIILIDANGALVEANPILERMTGLDKEQAMGRKVWDLEYGMLPEATRSEDKLKDLRAKWGNVIAGEHNATVAGPFETLIGNTFGVSRIIEQVVFPISMGDGRMVGAILRDVTEQRAMTVSLSESLREKELLLQEVHHRVKNNLQIICSLINMQLNGVHESASTRLSLMDIEARVRSISLVHELLYQSDNFACVDFESYISQLVDYLSEIYAIDTKRVKITTSVSDVRLPLDKAIPCGLLINEMVVNSLKYAFPNDRSGTIEVSIDYSGEQTVSLKVSDDGIGIPQSLLEGKERPSVGLSLVRNLVKQLGGSYEIMAEAGVKLRVLFNI
jgi:PAS domain S-box-containing protein